MVVASLNVDLVSQTRRLPRPGETVIAIGSAKALGGKGGNQVVALARLGTKPRVIAAVGTDENGQSYLDALKKEGIDIENVSVVQEHTGTAIITVDQQGNNTIVVLPGANSLVPDLEEEVALGGLENNSVVLAQLEVPLSTVERYLSMARSRGHWTVLNPAPAHAQTLELLKFVDVLIPNELEFEELTGESAATEEGIKRGAGRLLDLGVSWVIVTLGARGAALASNDQLIMIAAKEVKSVDSTAAGDSFVAGVVHKLVGCAALTETVLLEACEFARDVAALTVQTHGAQPSLPTLEQVQKA